MIPIVYIFIVLVAAYVTIGFFKVPAFDLILISLSLVVIVGTIVHGHSSAARPTVEHYVDLSAGDFKPIVLEEDIAPIKNHLVVYNTAFNKNSFSDSGSAWLNIAATKSDGTCDTKATNSIFAFELQPVFTRKSGFYMGNNRLIGPYCNSLKLQFHNTFTIAIACKHGNLLVDDSNNEIELFKFYANSPNNNGLSMYIQKNSLQNVNNVQMGNLMFQYSSSAAMQCKLGAADTKISFERDVLTFYFIVKDTDHIRMLMMTEKNAIIQEILKFNVQNTDVTFSNKEFVLNRMKNWNGNVYTLAMYDVALPDEDVANLHAHVVSEYMKYVNPNFIDIINQYNDTLAQLSKFLECPYSKDVCEKCSTVSKWYDVSQLLTAPKECRASIATFCSANPTHALCRCWNSELASYKTDSCKMFRSIFSEGSPYLDGLTQEEIDYIMSKYGLIKPEDCPKPVVAPKFQKTKYTKYDFNKLKVNVDGVDPAVEKTYASDAVEDEYSWDKLKIRYDSSSKPPAEATAASEGDLKIANYYKSDASTNYKLDATDASKEYERIKALALKEQQKLNDTKDLNIAPAISEDLSQKATDAIIPYHKTLFPGTQDAKPAPPQAAEETFLQKLSRTLFGA